MTATNTPPRNATPLPRSQTPRGEVSTGTTPTTNGPQRGAHGLKFYPGKHTYKLDGQPVQGVTTLLGVLDKPAIPKWAAKQVAEYVTNNPQGVTELRNLGPSPMVEALARIPWAKRDAAAERGTTIHDYAERILGGEEIEIDDNDPLVPVIENAVAFMDAWQIRPVLVEAAVASREHQWAGKLDLIAHYRRPDTGHEGVAIFDWKSGKGIYPEYAWQLNAYAHAEFYGEEGDEHPMPQCDAAFGVQVRSDGYDTYPFPFGPDIYAEFLRIRELHPIVKRARGDWKIPGSGYVGISIKESA